MADELICHIWGKVSSEGDLRPEEQQIDSLVAACYEEMGLTENSHQQTKIKSLIYGLMNHQSTIICAPTMNGKSTAIKVRVQKPS